MKIAKAVADPAAPKFYDQLSADTLNALVDDGTEGKGDSDDQAAATKISEECAKAMAPSS